MPSTIRLFMLTTVATIAAASAATAEAPFKLSFLGSQEIATGETFNGVEFGGISGLDRAPDGTYYALSDDRGGSGRAPRFYTMDFDIDQNGFNGVSIQSQVNLQRPDGTPFPTDQNTVDPEGLRVAPNGNLYVSSEGNFSSDPANLFQPFVREYQTDGTFVREFNLPTNYNYVDGATTGARNNRLLEALAVSPGGTVTVGNEGALVPDGPTSSATETSTVRLTTFDGPTGEPTAQYGYILPAGGFGLTELLALDETRFLALERNFIGGVGNTVNLTLLDILPTTTDVSAIDALDGATFEPLMREVLLTITPEFLGVRNDNLEAITFGETLDNGNPTLIIASDNNFNPNGQRSLFLAFELKPVPLPASGWMLLVGLGVFAALRRRAG